PDKPAGQQGRHSSASVDDSMRQVHDQLRDLASAMGQMRAEVTRSREEAAALRRELEETREQLSSLKRQLLPPGGTPENSEAAGSAATPSVVAIRGTSDRARALPSETDQSDNRVARLEEDERLLEAKVEEQEQTKVESGSKNRVRLSGI